MKPTTKRDAEKEASSRVPQAEETPGLQVQHQDGNRAGTGESTQLEHYLDTRLPKKKHLLHPQLLKITQPQAPSLPITALSMTRLSSCSVPAGSGTQDSGTAHARLTDPGLIPIYFLPKSMPCV